MAKRIKAERVEIAPNVYKASETSYYIDVNGTMKYCNKVRLDKLLAKAGGSFEKLVANYNQRVKGAKSPTPKKKKVEEVKEVELTEEIKEEILREEFPLVD